MPKKPLFISSQSSRFKQNWLFILLLLPLLIATTRAENIKKKQCAMQDPEMEVDEIDSEFYTLMNQVKYSCEYILGSHLIAEQEYQSEKEYVEVCGKMVGSMETNFPYTMNTAALKKLLKKQELTVILRTPKNMNGAIGTYEYDKHTIVIAWNKFFSEPGIRAVLSNELHHAAVCARNGGKTQECLSLPKTKELDNIIKKGHKKIEQYKILFDSKKPCKEIDELFTYIGEYEPFTRQTNASKIAHQWLLGQEEVTILKDGRLSVQNGGKFFAGAGQNTVYVTFSEKDANTFLYQWNFVKDESPHSKMRAFFLDIASRQEHYRSEAYSNGDFFNKNLSNKISEFASDLEQLPPALKKLFFPGFCEILSEFHQVRDYCSRPTLAS